MMNRLTAEERKDIHRTLLSELNRLPTYREYGERLLKELLAKLCEGDIKEELAEICF